jgi:hypothetical protein
MDNVGQRTPPITNEAPTKTSNNLSFLRVLSYGFTIVSVGILIAVGGYLLGSNRTKTQSETQVTNTARDSTTDWKTYQGNGFSFRYPKDWKKSEGNGPILSIFTTEYDALPEQLNNNGIVGSGPNTKSEFFTYKNNIDNKKSPYAGTDAGSWKFIQVDGKNAAQLISYGMDGKYSLETLLFTSTTEIQMIVALPIMPKYGSDFNKNQELEISLNKGVYDAQTKIIVDQFNQQIIPTFKFTIQSSLAISQQQAAQLVQNLPEVKDFLEKTPNGKISLSPEKSSNNFWTFHVYEDFADHQATFNWYDVDKVAGKITKQI